MAQGRGRTYARLMSATSPFGRQLRDWRQRRRLSQLALACDAEISARHLSFLESGRARPSRAMVLRLAAQLDLPLREQNALLLAAGYAPAFTEHRFEDPALASVRQAVGAILAAHEPFPALAINRHWTLVAANRSLAPLLDGVAETLLNPPVNVLRVALDPRGLAPRIANLPEWRHHLLDRLRRDAVASGDPQLAALHADLAATPQPSADRRMPAPAAPALAVPLQLVTQEGLVSLLSTTMVFGTATDILLSELAIETFLPADPSSSAVLRRLVAAAA